MGSPDRVVNCALRSRAPARSSVAMPQSLRPGRAVAPRPDPWSRPGRAGSVPATATQGPGGTVATTRSGATRRKTADGPAANGDGKLDERALEELLGALQKAGEG